MKLRCCINLFSPGVFDARWYPLYDLYASSQDGKPSTSIFLHYRVNLSQRTGEDWKDVKLILSTSEIDVLNAGVPKSDDLVIEPKQPPPSPPSKRKSTGTKQTARRTRASRFLDVEAEILEADSESDDNDEDHEYDELAFDFTDVSLDLASFLPEIPEGGAAVSKTPMGVNYTVDELTTIMSDGEPHKVLVATVPFEAAISHITTPRKSPLAYLQVCSPCPISSSNLSFCGI